ncbi:hypothetical protein LVY65_08005 [Sphingomonas sp. G124]|uniref:RcnB family protein n=1 Tax=Sphingomonas cremea TaxID=2904799 RepID=A0A9X1QMT1_9SPHN|nr:hypothetical protein [Sphingomonas cremea]MCF2515007.1 hypothetical protein [Sphingomonas cremea]
MLKWMLAAGAAALAITSPAQADPKGGRGGGNQNHAGHVAKAQSSSGGGQRVDRGNDRGGNHQAHSSQRAERTQFAQRDERQHGGGHGKVQTADRGSHAKNARLEGHGGNRGKNAVRQEDHGGDRVRTGRVDNNVRVNGHKGRDNDIRVAHVDRDVHVMRVDRDFDGVRFVPRWNDHGLSRGFIDGCPPGLAKKGNGCLPPGQARKYVGTPLNAALRANTLGWPYREWYRDDDRYLYRWDNDYIYRVNRGDGLIAGLFPYANRDYYYYPMGVQYPADYNYYNVPYQYQTYYPDNGDYWYRYGDGAIYQVNPGTGLIQGIAALLTGVPLGVGQPLPPSYGVYNVPFAYRDQYYDTPNDWYRYNDGYIYRVDPATQLITAIVSAIV